MRTAGLAVIFCCVSAAVGGATHRMRSGCRKGDLAKMEREIGAGVDINDADEFGFTCLHEAGSGGHVEVLRRALELGASPSAASNAGAGHRTGEQPLHSAATGGSADAAALLLEQNGVDVNAATASGMTALHFAAGLGHSALVELLLRRGADPNVANQFGSTPMHLAAADGQGGIVRTLLAGGAATDPVNKFGNSALHAAAAGGFEEVVAALVGAGASPTATNGDGEAPAQHMRTRARQSPEHAPSEEAMDRIDALLASAADTQRDEL